MTFGIIMKFLIYVFVIFCYNLSVIYGKSDTKNDKKDHLGQVCMATYAVYLIAITMSLMVISIISLAVALYLSSKSKELPSFEYTRQNSNNTSLKSVTRVENDYVQESTHVVNFGTLARKITPTSDLNTTPLTAPPTTNNVNGDTLKYVRKKPISPGVPIMPQAQIDEIVKAFSKKQHMKSDSITFRELDDMIKKSQETEAVDKNYITTELTMGKKEETKEMHAKDPNNSDNTSEQNQIESIKKINDNDENVFYDTLPSNARLDNPQSDYVQPVYDVLPTSNNKGNGTNHVVLDQETQYEFPLNKCNNTAYINANDVFEMKKTKSKTRINNLNETEEYYDTLPSDKRKNRPVYNLLQKQIKEATSMKDIAKGHDTEQLISIEDDDTAMYINAKFIKPK